MSIEGLSQHWQLSVSFQAPERLLRLQQAGGGPSESPWRTVPSAFSMMLVQASAAVLLVAAALVTLRSENIYRLVPCR